MVREIGGTVCRSTEVPEAREVDPEGVGEGGHSTGTFRLHELLPVLELGPLERLPDSPDEGANVTVEVPATNCVVAAIFKSDFSVMLDELALNVPELIVKAEVTVHDPVQALTTGAEEPDIDIVIPPVTKLGLLTEASNVGAELVGPLTMRPPV